MKKNIIIIAVVLLVIAVAATVIILNNNQENNDPSNSNITDSHGEHLNDTGKDASGGDTTSEKEIYYFEYKDVKIGINNEAAPILEALGEPMNYFEAPSCAFEGMDKIYSYSSFEFTTYTKDDKDYISSIIFLDDTVETREGIALNASLEEIINAYGNEYEKSFEQYSYTDGNCIISFILENNEVVSIEYAMDFQDNQEG